MSKLANQTKNMYLKAASLLKVKKSSPIVSELNIGTLEEPNIIDDPDIYNTHIAEMIKNEFANNSDCKTKYNIGHID